MIAAIARHISFVAGFTGALASIIPGLLLWPRLGRSAVGASFPRGYLVEMAVIGAIIFVTLLGRVAFALPAVWAACGLSAGFAVAVGVTIGVLYAPASGLFALSGVLGEVGPRKAPIRHLAVAAGAALLQVGIMAVSA